MALIVGKKQRVDRIAEREQMIANSKCILVQLPGAGWELQICGELSNIPSLKNSKLPGKNFINGKVLGKLKALSELYERTYAGTPYRLNFDNQQLWIVAILSNATKANDEDNVFAAIKDWLEPRARVLKKKKIIKDRGWGIGAIQNDRQVNGFAIKTAATGVDSDFTRIIIRPFHAARKNVLTHIAHHICGEEIDQGVNGPN